MFNQFKLIAQSNPIKFSDTLITHLIDRKRVNFDYLDSVMAIGFTQIQSGKNSTNALIGSMHIKKLEVPVLKKTEYGEIADTVSYNYQLQGLGHKVVPPSYKQQHIAFGGYCNIKLNFNFFEFIFDIENRKQLYFYGYFDEKGYMYLTSSFSPVKMENLELQDWIKYRPSYTDKMEDY